MGALIVLLYHKTVKFYNKCYFTLLKKEKENEIE